MAEWPVLSDHERRVLGVLIEKAKTTPDAYPLSLNALVTGCNQKSNRDPVMNLAEVDVEEALLSCQRQGLVLKITGGRVERWRHALYDEWKVGKVELAVLGELLLRGAQTEGELRGRASRMEPIDDLDALRNVLKPMAERRLVVYLTPEGRRGTVLTHGLMTPEELEHWRGRARAEFSSSEAPAESSRPAVREAPADETRAELAALRAQVAELQTAVADLGRQVQELKARQ